MIDSSVVKRLAIQCGAEVLTNDALITFEDYELQAFAQAVLESYKSGLVPVAWQFYQDGEWHIGSAKNNHKQNTIDGGYPVCELYSLNETDK